MSAVNWNVLLIGGHSAAGKTTAAELVGRSLGVPWMMMDDLRLAFQRARVSLPENTDALYFDTVPSFRRLSPQDQCDGLIAVGEALSPALEVIIEHHVDLSLPIVIEGDGILPSLLSQEAGGRAKRIGTSRFPDRTRGDGNPGQHAIPLTG